MDNMKGIITIGRELGSGGRSIGKLVAEKLGVPYYDRELIDEAAKESGLSPDFIEKNEQAVTGSFLYNLAMGNSYTYGTLGMTGTNALPLTMQVFLAQGAPLLHIHRLGLGQQIKLRSYDKQRLRGS